MTLRPYFAAHLTACCRKGSCCALIEPYHSRTARRAHALNVGLAGVDVVHPVAEGDADMIQTVACDELKVGLVDEGGPVLPFEEVILDRRRRRTSVE